MDLFEQQNLFSASQAPQLQVLASTSSGNSTIIWDDAHCLMVDCGLGIRYITAQLQALNLTLEAISRVFITHTHSDHVNQIFLKKLVQNNVPVVCAASLKRPLRRNHSILREAAYSSSLQRLDGDGHVVGKFSIQTFAVPHDSHGGCYGYAINYTHPDRKPKKITLATDLGEPHDELIPHFVDSDVIVIESNYDERLLLESSRPWWLKKRIQRAHLSNAQSAAFVRKIMEQSQKLPHTIALAHISQECNTNQNAQAALAEALAGRFPCAPQIVPTHMRKPSAKICI